MDRIGGSGRPVRRLLLALALTACATTPPPPPPEGPSPEDYAPFAVGSSWTYALSFQGQTGERTVKITGIEDGYFVDDQKGRFRHSPEGLRDPQRFLIRKPLVAGNTWKAIVSASAVENYSILSVGDPCSVRAGQFADCLVIESRLRRDAHVSLFIRFTWAKGVGLARIETMAEIDGRRVPQTDQSLLHYGLGAATEPPPAAPKEEGDDGPNPWQ